ncbi:MAG: hypothetical protein B6241_07145 [Spirochaetaceae bacterium 4572_59]|nr:MAG: hypothetical protein B6241_07145 [Spirochaetaceae bacterium 4572_59]
MKIYNKTLKKAYKYLKSGHYGKVISHLEPKVPLFIENYHFYYFLGTSCYYSGDMGGAETYLKRAIQVNRKSEDPRLFLAAVYLKKKDTTEAVRIWLGLLDLNSSQKKAKKGLNKIRKISDQDVLNSFLDAGHFAPLLPRTKSLIPFWFLPLFLAFIIMAGLYLSSSFWLPQMIRFQKPQRENLIFLYKDIPSEELQNESSTDAKYLLTEKEIKNSLKDSQNYFNDFHDNEARREINRINYSNAGEQVKLKANLLEGYLKDPDMISLKSAFTYKDVTTSPYLYENCFVLWKGRFTNLTYVNDQIEFDFLVGYEKSQILEGILPVIVQFPVNLDPIYPLELLAKVEIINDSTIRLQAVAVHNIIE